MTLSEFVEVAQLVPFVEKGRDWTGLDCWGLVRLAYLEIKNIELPLYLDYESTREYRQLKRIIDSAKPMWVEVKDPQAMDVAVFKISDCECHVALLTDPRNALHAEAKLGTFIEPLNSPMWAKRLEGIYRLCPSL